MNPRVVQRWLPKKRSIPKPLIKTLSQAILDVFASCGRITGYPEMSVASENVRFW
jgi:hypothetical protein